MHERVGGCTVCLFPNMRVIVCMHMIVCARLRVLVSVTLNKNVLCVGVFVCIYSRDPIYKLLS